MKALYIKVGASRGDVLSIRQTGDNANSDMPIRGLRAHLDLMAASCLYDRMKSPSTRSSDSLNLNGAIARCGAFLTPKMISSRAYVPPQTIEEKLQWRA